MSLLLLKQKGFVRGGLVAHYDFHKQNLLDFSEAFESPAWNATLVSVTADSTAAPVGSSTADLLAPTGSNAFIRQSVAVRKNQDYTFSVYLKSTGADRVIRISIHDVSLTLISSQPITVTPSWQRFEVAANSGVNTTLQVLIGGGSTWSSGEDVHAWGGQVNEGPAALSYESTTDNQTLRDVGGGGNDLTLGSSSLSEANDPTWAQHRLLFDGNDVAQRGVTNNLSIGNSSLTMMVAAKMSAPLTAEQVLLSYGSGLDGGTPNVRVNALDHLIVGFSGIGWTAEISSPVGSQSGFFMGTLRYDSANRLLEAILNNFSGSISAILSADPTATNEKLALGSTFAGLDAATTEIACALIYNRRLSNDEVKRVYRAVRQVLLSRGINLP